ncbi:General stress protein 39 [compost metagenome]
MSLIQDRTRNTLRFTLEDLDLFAQASHDWSPLHADDEYAYRTPYGARIAYGVQEELACLAALPDRQGYSLAQVTVEFLHPLFVDFDYEVITVSSGPEISEFRIYEGERLLVMGKALFRPGVPLEPSSAGAPIQARLKPAEFGADDLYKGRVAEGSYWPTGEALEMWMRRLRLREKGIGSIQVAALMWQTYLAGMELPGKHSLCQKLNMRFVETAGDRDLVAELIFRAEVAGYDARFNRMKAQAQLSAGGRTVAEAEVQAFLREPIEELTLQKVEAYLSRSNALNGQTAVVIGGSRGFGAATALGLALQGCTVISVYRRSLEAAEQLAGLVPEGCGRIIPVQGDAANPRWCEEKAEELARLYGEPDLLVVGAGLPLLPSALHADTLGQIQSYVSQSLALAGAPLAAWAKRVAARKGWCAVLSAASVAEAPHEYPHFVAAKLSVEGLAAAAVKKHGGNLLIMRPPKMRTDLSNTPLGRYGSIPPEQAAADLVRRVLRKAESGGAFEIIDSSF